MSVPPSIQDPFGSPQPKPYAAAPPLAPPAPQPGPQAYPGAQPGQAAYPAGASGYQNPQPVYPPQPGYQAQQWHPPQPFQAPPKPGNGLAITAVVLGGLALIGVLVLGAVFAMGASMSPSWVLQGQVAVTGQAVGASELQAALAKAVEDDGGFVDEITCPASSAVGQGLVTVCHGSVDGWDWTGLVVFEDADGAFIVNEL